MYNQLHHLTQLAHTLLYPQPILNSLFDMAEHAHPRLLKYILINMKVVITESTKCSQGLNDKLPYIIPRINFIDII
jgi:hypothetical protein